MSFLFKKLISGIFLVFILSFFLFPHTTHANVLTRAPSNLGLVGYWSFNEGVGTIAGDYSGNGRNGILNTFSVPPTTTSGWGNGKLGKGLNFDGSSDYISGPDLDFPTGNFTISAWFKYNPGGGKIVSKTFDFSNFNYELWIDSSTEIYGGLYDGATGQYAGMTGANLNDGNWHHAVFVVDSSTLKLYLDGVLGNVTDTFGGSITTNNQPMEIGAETAFGGYHKGSIDEVRIYNRALTATEVTTLYKSGGVTHKLPNNLGLVGYWSMNEGDGTTAFDYSGNKNTGTMSGFSDPATVTSGWGNGKFGKSLVFDGSNDNIDGGVIPGDSLNITTNTMTISTWVKGSALNQAGVLFVKGSGGAGGYRLAIGTTVNGCTTNEISFTKFNLSQYCLGTVSGDRSWHHVAVVSNGSGLISYVDSVQVGTGGDGTVIAATTQGYSIGYDRTQGNGIYNWNGSIDEVRVYNRALTSDEVAGLYNGSKYTAINTTPTNVVTSGLVGYWPFDGKYVNWGTGQVSDVSGTGNNAQVVNMSTTTSPVLGKVGQALSFNGTNSYVNAGDPANGSLDFEKTNPLTISAWVNRSKLGSSMGVVYKRTSVGSGYDLSITSGDVVQFNLGDNFGSGNRIGIDTVGTIPNINQWYHVVASYNGNAASSGITMYIDGVNQSLTNAFDALGAGSTLTTEPLSIGARETGTARQFKGKIDEVRVYNRVLSSTEILQLYRAGR